MPTAALPIVPVILWEPLTAKKDNQPNIVPEITGIFVVPELPVQMNRPALKTNIVFKLRKPYKAVAAAIVPNAKTARKELAVVMPNALPIPPLPDVKMFVTNAVRHLSAIVITVARLIQKKPAVLMFA